MAKGLSRLSAFFSSSPLAYVTPSLPLPALGCKSGKGTWWSQPGMRTGEREHKKARGGGGKHHTKEYQ